MASVCISNCINDARDPRVPVRASYVNLYKWPESDAEFVRSVSSNGRKGSSSQSYGHPRIVDSISCRQIYLRSYTFSREEEQVPEKTQKCCFGRVKKNKKEQHHHDFDVADTKKNKTNKVWKKAKEISCSTLFRIFQTCLSCSATVDVVDAKD